MPWWVPLPLLILVAAVLAYLTGIVAVRRLGSAVASFVALTEVLFAVVFAAVLLGQQPEPGPAARRACSCWPASSLVQGGSARPRRGRSRRASCYRRLRRTLRR